MSLAELPLSTPPVQRLADVYDTVAAAARDTPAGSWIVGAGYDQNRLAERRHPTAQELDAVAPAHRVWLRHTSGHMAVVNGAVLAQIGIDATEVPAGGQVERDAAGRATGLLLETAQSLVRDLVHPSSVDDIADAIDRATRHYLTEGITSAPEAGIGAGLVAWSPRELSAGGVSCPGLERDLRPARGCTGRAKRLRTAEAAPARCTAGPSRRR